MTSPLEELERLRKRFIGYPSDRNEDDFSDALLTHADWLLSAARERDELRADAARYKWLQQWCDIHFNDDGTFSHLENAYGTPNPKTELTARLQAKLDAAIDAAKGDGG